MTKKDYKASRITGMLCGSTECSVANAIDAEFCPDGALYVLEYGDGYFTANPDARRSKIEYARPAR